jgi:hypothetical protein
MAAMDLTRRLVGTIWVAVGLGAMLVWTAGGPRHAAGVATWAVVVVVAGGTALSALSAGRSGWWGGRVAGAVIGAELVGAVADRFGLLGGPGSPGVSWGDWSHFRAETAELVPWSALVSPAAVAATVAELTLGLLLIAGPWWRWTGTATAALFAVYLVAMVPGTGAASVLEYGVPVLVGGALVASARGPRRLIPSPQAGAHPVETSPLAVE